jgi:hypothetical protein
MFRKKLSLAHKRLAVQVARTHWAAASGNRVEYERLVKEDRRTKAIDPALIALFIQVLMAVFQYFSNRQVSGLSVLDQKDDEVFVGAIRYGA